MLIEEFPNSRQTYHGLSLLSHQQPLLYPITPPHHNSPPYHDFRHSSSEPIDALHMNHTDDSYNFRKLHYYASLQPANYYPTLYPSPPQSISPPSQSLQQLISYRKHGHYDGSERFVLDSDEVAFNNRRNSVIMKVQDHLVVPSMQTGGSPTARVSSDSDEENFMCKWESCFR